MTAALPDLVDEMAHRNMAIFVLASGVAAQLGEVDDADLRNAVEQIRTEAISIHSMAKRALTPEPVFGSPSA